MSIRYSLVVRYSECDMQRVVHNSVYLRWCDDLADDFFRESGAQLEAGTWDVMVKAASITWSGPARVRDRVDIDIEVTRWGTTSFDVGFAGSRDGEALFEATMTYVAVRPDTLDTMAVPDEFRRSAGADPR